MADTSLGFNLVGRDVSASRTLRGVGDQATRTSGAFASMGKIAGGVFGGFALTAGIAKVADYMRDAATAAMEDEKSQVALATAMRNVGAAHHVPEVENFIKDLMLATGVADDQLRPAYQNLVTATGDVTESQKLLQLAMDVSVGTGKNLESVTQALAKAHGGNLGALNRLAPVLDADTVKSKNFADATDQLTQKFKGQAAAAAETMAGKLQRISTAASEAQESIGYGLIDSLNILAGAEGNIDGTVNTIARLGDEIGEGIRLTARGIDATRDALSGLVGNVPGVEALADALSKVNLGTGVIGIIVQASDAIKALTGDTDAWAKVTSASTEGAIVSYRDASGAVVTYKDGIKQVVDEHGNILESSEDAAAALQELTAAQQAFNTVVSYAQGRLEFTRWLRDLDENVAKQTRTFDGYGAGARKNQDAVMEGFRMAAEQSNRWAKRTGADLEEYEANFAGRGAKVVRQFVDEGFDLKDIRKFLKSQGMWSDELQAVFSKEKHVAAYAKAMTLGAGLGKNLALGLAQGIADGTPGAAANAKALVEAAERAARNAAEINSPSKLMMREVGEPLAEGVAAGIDKGSSKAVAAGVKMVKTVTDEMAKAAAIASGVQDVIAGNAQDFADLVTDAWGEVSSALADAQGALDDFVNGAKDTFTSGIDLGAAWTGQWDSAGKATGISLVQGFENQVRGQEWFQNVIKAIREQGGSDALIQEIMSKGVAIGGALGQGILDQGLVGYFSENLATVEDSATQTANAIVPAFITAGLAAAQAMSDSFVATFGPQGAGRTALMEVMDSLSRDMGRTVNIDVAVASVSGAAIAAVAGLNMPHFADGGIVTGPTIGLLGEAGDEAVIPLDRLGSMRGKGGGDVYIDVHVSGSVMSERDLVTTVRDGIGREMRRRGKDPSVIGL